MRRRPIFLGDDVVPERFVVIGLSADGRTLTVVHVERGLRERIISARRATAGEEALYASSGS